jgi:hypothetical protein
MADGRVLSAIDIASFPFDAVITSLPVIVRNSARRAEAS